MKIITEKKIPNYIISRFFLLIITSIVVYYYITTTTTTHKKCTKTMNHSNVFFLIDGNFLLAPLPSLRLDSKLDSNSTLSSLLECEKLKNNAAGADSVRIPFFRSYYYIPYSYIYIRIPNKPSPSSPFLPLP